MTPGPTTRTTAKVGSKLVGDGHSCFITLEAGPTHDGLETARKLVSAAAAGGADAVKFQIMDPERLIADKSVMFDYQVLADKTRGDLVARREPLYDLLKSRALKPDEWRNLKKHADDCGIEFFATVGFPDEVDLVTEMNCSSIKIASGDITHIPLIRYAASTGLCIQLDTGNATMEELYSAVAAVEDTGNSNLVIHHCPSGYPASLDGVRLNMISALRSRFRYPIAFSDHSPGWDMDIVAVAAGAAMVEKTITLNRGTDGVEHVMSIETDEIPAFVEAVRNTETAIGIDEQYLSKDQAANRLNVRRSPYLIEDAPAGQKLGDLKVEFRRPGIGISPAMFIDNLEQRLKSSRSAGACIDISDFE